MEFEEHKVIDPRESAPSNKLSKHSKSRSGPRSKRRQKKSSPAKLSRTGIIARAHGKRGRSEHSIVVQGGSVIVGKNRSQMLAVQANDGSVGASDSVAGVIKRNARSKSNGRVPVEQLLARSDPVFKADVPSN